MKDLFGNEVLGVLEVGNPECIVAPTRKALWHCKYKLRKADLDVIYDVANTHEIAFGKSWYVHLARGTFVFKCWHPSDRLDDIDRRIRDTFGTSQYEFASTAFRYAQQGVRVTGRIPLVRVQSITYRTSPGMSWTSTDMTWEDAQGNTFAEAIEAAVWKLGMGKLGKVFG